MEYALADRGANGAVCGYDMLEVKILLILGRKVNWLRIVTAQALATKQGLLPLIMWLYLVKARVHCLVYKWKHIVPTLMIALIHELVVYNLFLLMDTNFHWISRMYYHTFDSGNQLKRKLARYHKLS
jgi:hypothetical protein